MRNSGILVVDDDRANIGIIEKLFEHFNIKADYVMNAASALDLLRTRDYRTVITDLDIPDMDGLELTRRVREQFPYLDVVLFTGNTSPHIMKQALEADVAEIYCKPLGFGDMLMSILTKEREAHDPAMEQVRHWC